MQFSQAEEGFKDRFKDMSSELLAAQSDLMAGKNAAEEALLAEKAKYREQAMLLHQEHNEQVCGSTSTA